eukprot:9502731-Pyramimonas_sp.AAC.2
MMLHAVSIPVPQSIEEPLSNLGRESAYLRSSRPPQSQRVLFRLFTRLVSLAGFVVVKDLHESSSEHVPGSAYPWLDMLGSGWCSMF